MSPSKQDLIIPIQIEIEPLSASALEAHINQLNEYGFSIESFGKNFYRILSIPDCLKIEHVEKFVLDLVDQLRTRGSYSKTQTNLFSGSCTQCDQRVLFHSEKEHASSLEKLPTMLSGVMTL